jgi:hypothetical protein
VDAAGVERQPIESPFGAFIACSEGKQPATVRILDANEIVLLSWTFGGHFDPDHLPTAFGGLAEFHPGAHGADPSCDEAAIIQVSTRETTGDEMRQLLHKAADGPSGLTPSAREQLKSRLQAGDDPTTIAQWLMTVRREPDQDGVQ